MTANSDAVRLAGELHSAGFLSAECRPAFEAVPREFFIPDRIWVQPDDKSPYLAVDRATSTKAWLKYVYSDRVIVTQMDDGDTEWPTVGYRPTSSASMPSAVAGMLVALDAQPGEAVCEIGTGTGFNAALLAERVGPDGAVTTVEIDPVVARSARANLNRAGYSRLVTRVGDAVTGEFDGGPWRRTIATAGVHLGQLPYSWVANTRTGGVILAPMRTDLASGPLAGEFQSL